MNLQVSKWDGSLALRLPPEFVRHHSLQDGANLHAEISSDGTLTLKPARWDRAAYAAELALARAALPASRAAVEELRAS
jgi:antitoxin MazE